MSPRQVKQDVRFDAAGAYGHGVTQAEHVAMAREAHPVPVSTPPARPREHRPRAGAARRVTASGGEDPPDPSLAEAAIKLVERGYRVLPLAPAGKRPHRTLAPRGVKSASNDPATVREWWARCPDSNIGVAATAGVLVLDVDGREGIEALKALRLDLAGVPTVRSGSGDGLHLYFGGESPTGHCADAGKHLDLRGAGAYVVAPPSRHESGGRYEWLTPGAPLPVSALPPLPEKLQPGGPAPGVGQVPPGVGQVPPGWEPVPPAPGVIEALREHAPRFRATWDRQRAFSRDQSRSDMSLAGMAATFGFTPEEAAGLIQAHRTDKKADRLDYLYRTVAKAWGWPS